MPVVHARVDRLEVATVLLCVFDTCERAQRRAPSPPRRRRRPRAARSRRRAPPRRPPPPLPSPRRRAPPAARRRRLPPARAARPCGRCLWTHSAGRLRVSTATTPGVASAASLSTRRMRACASVASTGRAWRRPVDVSVRSEARRTGDLVGSVDPRPRDADQCGVAHRSSFARSRAVASARSATTVASSRRYSSDANRSP